MKKKKDVKSLYHCGICKEMFETSVDLMRHLKKCKFVRAGKKMMDVWEAEKNDKIT